MPNDLAVIMPKILSRGLMTLRKKLIMVRLVNGDYSLEAAEFGDTIDVPIPAVATGGDVTPSQVPPAPSSLTPTKVQVPLDKWKHSDFHLTDKQKTEVNRNAHFLPMQTEAAVDYIAQQMNSSVFARYVGVYGFVGTAGTTPFGGSGPSTTTMPVDATDLKKRLSQQKAPRGDRRVVLDFEAEGNFSQLRSVADVSQSTKPEVPLEGEMGRFYGMDWYSDDDVPLHTAGTASGATTNAAGYAVGIKTVTLASAGTGTFVVGDIITFAGDTQTYVITSGDADVSNGGTISFEPGLVVAIGTSATAITRKASHRVNLGFHRNAFAVAIRPLMKENVDQAGGSTMMQISDPLTGIPLRLEVMRQYKQNAWDFDELWGDQLVRAPLAVRLAG